MGTTASCSNGESLPPQIIGSSESLRLANSYSHSGGSHDRPPENVSSQSYHATSDPQRERMSALNTIQRQKDELAELTRQLHQRDQELRLIRDLRTREDPATLDESVKLRDLRIRKLEEDVERGKSELAKQKSRYKRKIRELVTQLAEVKQSTTIRIMELRQEVHQMSLENRQLKERLGLSETALVASTPRPAAAEADADAVATGGESGGGNSSSSSKTLIVELSGQLSDQSEQLRRLRRQLQEREAHIAQLEAVASPPEAGEQPATNSGGVGGAIRRKPLKPQPPVAERLNSEFSFVSTASAEDDAEAAMRFSRSHLGGGGDADSIYSDDTLLFVEMQQHDGGPEAAGGGGGGGCSVGVKGIIFDSYKQRTIDKLLQD